MSDLHPPKWLASFSIIVENDETEDLYFSSDKHRIDSIRFDSSDIYTRVWAGENSRDCYIEILEGDNNWVRYKVKRVCVRMDIRGQSPPIEYGYTATKERSIYVHITV